MFHVVLKFVHFPWKIWRLKAKKKHNQQLSSEIFLRCLDQIEDEGRVIDFLITVGFPLVRNGVQDKTSRQEGIGSEEKGVAPIQEPSRLNPLSSHLLTHYRSGFFFQYVINNLYC